MDSYKSDLDNATEAKQSCRAKLDAEEAAASKSGDSDRTSGDSEKSSIERLYELLTGQGSEEKAD